MQIMYTFYVIGCVSLIAIGLFLVFYAIPYLSNSVHSKIEANRVYLFKNEKLHSYFYVKLETSDAFVANNPIDISIVTPNIDRNKTRGLQITFDGASAYFPNFTKLNIPSSLTTEELEKAIDELNEEVQRMSDSIGKNIISLQNDTDKDWTSFSGNIQNLTFSTGGKFDIGITINNVVGGVTGYEMGDRNCAIKEAIEISPPEVLIQVNNANIMTGLAWIGVSLPFLIAGLTGLMEIIKHYAFLP